MSYRILLAVKRLAADKPTVLMTLGELRAQEATQLRKGERSNAVTKR